MLMIKKELPILFAVDRSIGILKVRQKEFALFGWYMRENMSILNSNKPSGKFKFQFKVS